MSRNTLEEDIHNRLYVELLESLTLDDFTLKQVLPDMVLNNSLNTESRSNLINNKAPRSCVGLDDDSPKSSAILESELQIFGAPIRYHLSSSLRHQLLEEVIKTLQSISDFFHGDQHANDSVQSLPQDILAFKSEMHSTEQEIDHTAGRINDLMLRISQTYKAFEEEIKQAKSTTFPAFDAARVASNDLLAATIETALIKLSLIQAKTERKLYGPQVANRAEPSKTVAKALEVAFASLKKEEKELEKESCALDAQLHEYESLLQFVDGGTGGYRQVVDDWTKVKKETNECKKDLRRLGWTGD